MAARLPEIHVIRDTREREGHGWFFEPEEKVSGRVRVSGTTIQTMDAGDYTMVGYEHLVRIERKYGFGELFGNFTPKDKKERFEREMERLRDIPEKYIVIESGISKDNLCLSVGQQFKGPTVNALVKWLLELHMEYGIVPIFAGDAGKRMARNIFEQTIRRYQ